MTSSTRLTWRLKQGRNNKYPIHIDKGGCALTSSFVYLWKEVNPHSTLRNSQFIILNSQLLPQTSQQNYVWIFLCSIIGNARKWIKMDGIIRFSE